MKGEVLHNAEEPADSYQAVRRGFAPFTPRQRKALCRDFDGFVFSSSECCLKKQLHAATKFDVGRIISLIDGFSWLLRLIPSKQA
jgi:hypothetical protein